jgi:hypothetical protein
VILGIIECTASSANVHMVPSLTRQQSKRRDGRHDLPACVVYNDGTVVGATGC